MGSCTICFMFHASTDLHVPSSSFDKIMLLYNNAMQGIQNYAVPSASQPFSYPTSPSPNLPSTSTVTTRFLPISSQSSG